MVGTWWLGTPGHPSGYAHPPGYTMVHPTPVASRTRSGAVHLQSHGQPTLANIVTSDNRHMRTAMHANGQRQWRTDNNSTLSVQNDVVQASPQA